MQPQQLKGYTYAPQAYNPSGVFAQLEAQRKAAATAKQPKQKKGRGGLLSSLISELGGLGGAAAGQVLIPIPFLGAAIGAGVGSFAGRLAENKVRDDRTDSGSLKEALGEGLISGAFAGTGSAFKTLKAARAGLGAADDVGGFLSKAGGSLRQNVVNPKTTASVFGAADDRAITNTVNKYVKGISASGKYRNLGSAVTNISDDISRELGKVPQKTKITDLTKRITQNLSDDLRYVPGDAAYERELSRALTKLNGLAKGGTLSAGDMFKYKQYLGSQLKGAFGKNAADLTVPQQVRMAVWENMDDVIGKTAPNVKNLTVAQSRLIQSAKGLQQASNKTAGVPLLGLRSKGLESTIQGAQELTGRALQLPGRIGALGGGLGTNVKAMALSGAIRNMAAPPQEEPQDFEQMLGEDTMAATPMDAQIPMQSPAVQESPYPLANAIADIRRDPKNAKQYMQYYEFVNEAMTGPQQKPLNSTAAGTVTDLQNGIANIRGLSQDFASSNANDPLLGRVRRLNPYDTGAQTLQANIARVKQVIGKALEGGVLRKEDEVKYAKILPTLNDTDEVAQRKIQAIADDLDRKLYLYQQNLGGGGGGQDFSSLSQALSTGGYY